ncbi:DUF6231 family protein [Psychrobacter sp. AOP5-CZ1-12]|uniref:DUF6231 family protein n=1 Tax=Psychrobacter sp. AOP5-CZ1-12 TaxID=3457651 RepID=UPI00402BB8D6
MTKHATSRSDITLPLLINYVDALLPSLAIQEETPKTTDQTFDITELLWVVEDKNAQSAVKAQLENYLHHQKNDVTIANSDTLQIVTLLELTKQQTPERYELACFWLPTLSVERLQHYIPLLMRYRDLYAAHLLIALEHNIDLQPYGFTPFDILQTSILTEDTDLSGADMTQMPAAAHAFGLATLWQFNLYDYKQLPNWLNADYWANPENWDKHRW